MGCKTLGKKERTSPGETRPSLVLGPSACVSWEAGWGQVVGYAVATILSEGPWAWVNALQLLS